MKYIITAVILLSMLLCCGNKPGNNENIDTQKMVLPGSETVTQNDIPPFEITFTNGAKTMVNKLTGKIALVLFQPDCDHCQREAQQIQLNLAGFKDYKLYFISSATMPEITRFAQQYKLADLGNVLFARTEAQNIVKAFGPIEAPSIYLYKNGTLVESFNGEVAIEVVLKYI